jgi:hypothetical protein
MARMERVAVWSLMSGGGGGRDVFNVSSRDCGPIQVLFMPDALRYATGQSSRMQVAGIASSVAC